MTDQELFEHNASVMQKMNSSTAAIIQATLRCIKNSATKIKLIDPPISEDIVDYELLEGETRFVKACGRVSGLSNVTDSRLEASI